jgi:hypothetical protein
MHAQHNPRVASIGTLGLLALVLPAAWAQTSGRANVLTQDYDIARSGANLGETTLTPANVSSATFGKLFAFAVDNAVLAQPLYVSNLTIAGGVHNTLFVATTGNSVYAFDANNPSTTNAPLWSVNLGPPVPPAKYDFSAASYTQLGIVGTPVIDKGTSTLYVVAHVWDTATQTGAYSLHALALATGSEKFGGPVQISATGFNPDSNWQRSGLLLLHGVLYVPIASYGDLLLNVATQASVSYSGMIIAYNPATLAQRATFNAEPHGAGAGIWQSARGPASDGTYVYAMTGNAWTTGAGDLAGNFVKLNPGTLTLADNYTDPNAACLNKIDLDLGSSGPLIMPGTGTNLMVGGGKQGKVFVLQLDETLQTQTPETFWGASQYLLLPADGGVCANNRGNGVGYIGSTAYWNNAGGPLYYILGGADNLYSFQLASNTFSESSADTPANVWPSTLAVSANGSQNGILWVVAPQPAGFPTMYAFDAAPVGGHLTPLWNSAQLPDRDVLGDLARHTVPTVANGMVYVASGSNQVAAYGLLPTSPAVQITLASPTIRTSGLTLGSYNIWVNSLGGYAGTVSLSVSGLPPGATYSLSETQVTLTAGGSVHSRLTISLSDAVLPLQDTYTLVVQATAGGVNSYAPVRIQARGASFTAMAKVACNSSDQMSASFNYASGGSSTPSIWIQDPTTPTFPGRLWTEVPTSGTEQTGYWIDDKKHNYLYWMFDQSAGGSAIFDNALTVTNLSGLYSCP